MIAKPLYSDTDVSVKFVSKDSSFVGNSIFYLINLHPVNEWFSNEEVEFQSGFVCRSTHVHLFPGRYSQRFVSI